MRHLLFTSLSALIFLCSFNHNSKEKLKLPVEFVFIPAGTYYSVEGKTSTQLDQYYISKFETTNLQYRNFLQEVSTSLPPAELEKIKCDSSGWSRITAKANPLSGLYFTHPSYNEFPVVNISYYGAAKYCEWLQQKLQIQNQGFVIEVRLPSRPEWIHAAEGGRSSAMFPWDNYYLRNKKGDYLCNFKRVPETSIYRNRATGRPEIAEFSENYSDTYLFTASVKSYYPNNYKLYNMCGNAAEMVSEKGVSVGGSWNDYGGEVQIRAESSYEKSAATVGFRPVILVKQKSR